MSLLNYHYLSIFIEILNIFNHDKEITIYS